MVTILVILAVAVVVAATAGFVASTRRRRILEPPARPSPEQAPAGRRPEEGALSDESLAELEPIEELELVEEAPRLRDRLGRARAVFAERLGGVLGRGRADEEALEELEEALILADVGVSATTALVARLRERMAAKEIGSPAQLVAALRSEMIGMLGGVGGDGLDAGEGSANVWLFVGVNGVGKTTTIAKVARRAAQEGKRVVLAAGDTFRAAAAEQLGHWAQRVEVDIVSGAQGADPGSVVFDAVQRAAARGMDLVLADTAGRLHTKVNLMEELKKVKRVASRPPGQVREVLLVIDATTGQNGLVQARQFTEAVGVTGVVLTKMDGSAKGGIALAIRSELGIPIKLVGVGEGPADLVDFDAEQFVDALLGEAGQAAA